MGAHCIARQEEIALNAFKNVVENFLGNYRVPNCIQLVDKMLQAYKTMGCVLILRIGFLYI